MAKQISELGDETKQIQVYVDPNEVKKVKRKSRAELQKQLEMKILAFVELCHWRSVR